MPMPKRYFGRLHGEFIGPDFAASQCVNLLEQTIFDGNAASQVLSRLGIRIGPQAGGNRDVYWCSIGDPAGLASPCPAEP